MKEKTYNLKITENELKNSILRKALVNIVGARLKMQKTNNYFKISSVEYEILKRHYSWTDTELYLKNKKDRMPGEVGKYQGKRCVLKGKKN